ncbi:hypothetical protein JHK87_050621 [Glycine soja]|nr:hypothetical protein JHK87_050621 [Glycine soja]
MQWSEDQLQERVSKKNQNNKVTSLAEKAILVFSLRSLQFDLVWECCRQLQAQDLTVKGKMTIGELMDAYEVCISNLQKAQSR